ncbi:MAG: RQC domain-containing protein, partial [Bacillota bacterium]|nr:RQC domain-containing protein [Bacillota bacterium]
MEVAFSSSEMTGIPKEEIRDITSEAQRIVLCVDISRERYGKGLIVDILRGSRNKKILENGLDRLSTYGVLSELSREMLYLILNELCINGLLMVTADFYPVLKLTERSR